MISILIPIYNEAVEPLVKELIRQCQKAKVNFEIICLDDYSKESIRHKNRPINGLFGVNYVELSENIGRGRIRNRMAKLARYDYLLFLDSDSKLASKKFIKKYKTYLEGTPIIIGGTKYQTKPPKNKDKLLHWHYGIKRESQSLQVRNRNPSRYFHSNNFVIHREIILQHPFSEYAGYGYEDIALGESLRGLGFEIMHIDNPVLHTGLKKREQFLKDQKESINNLVEFYKRDEVNDTKLIIWYERLDKWNLLELFKRAKLMNEQKLLESLKDHPKRLIYLDLLKLYYFDQAIKSQ